MDPTAETKEQRAAKKQRGTDDRREMTEVDFDRFTNYRGNQRGKRDREESWKTSAPGGVKGFKERRISKSAMMI